MQIRLSPRYLFTFLLLLIVMLELHEIVHITTGYIICGCFGERDFNVWDVCTGCNERSTYTWLSTLTGPLFSFALMWVGMFLLSSKSIQRKAFGFSLIFSNIPFGRITTVMMGGGDEMVVMKHFLKNDLTRSQMILLCSLIVLLLGVPPVIRAWQVLTNKRSWIYIIGFLTLPLLFLLLYILGAMNALLGSGFLSTIGIMGTPLLITLHTALAAILLILFRKNIFLIAKQH